MPYIQINERISIKKSRTDIQCCVYCGKKINRVYALNMSNKGDELAIHKNLWLHIKCMKPYAKLLLSIISSNKKELVAMGI